MAKAKKSKSAKSGKLPKTVAGIELPKELRKQGAKLLDLVKNPLVGDLVAAGLVALAANVRNQGKTGGESSKDKQNAADGFSKTAATLATVVATRAAEKITSKLNERPAPAAPTAPKASSSTAAPKPAARKPATRKVAAKPKAPAGSAGAKPAAAKPAATRTAAKSTPAKTPAARKPAAKPATRRPAARKPAAKPAS